MTKKISFFVLALVISLIAAMHRWGDSAHSIGLINTDGGKVRHASIFKGKYDKYTLIATATVIPPYRGDAKVILEGDPKLEHEIHFSAPVVDLGLRNLAKFKNNVLYNLRPKDRLALWVIMRPPAGKQNIAGQYNLALYDTKTDKSILKVPLKFKTKEADNAEQYQH